MAQDILLNSEMDLTFKSGDYDFGTSDAQHVEHHLLLQKAELKDAVNIGIGIANKLNSPMTRQNKQQAMRELRMGLRLDGADKIAASWTETLKAEAVYE